MPKKSRSQKNPPYLEHSGTDVVKTLRSPMSRLKKALLVIWLLVVVVGLTILGATLFKKSLTSDPVPQSVRNKVSFSVYYPVQAKLPAGYTLKTSSFSATNVVVVYQVNLPNNQKMVFSIQAKPTTAQLQTFITRYMPLNIPIHTPIGSANLSAFNGRDFVSLPTNGSAWILITAPLNMNQTKLTDVLDSLVKAS
jgi:hypothetical protein